MKDPIGTMTGITSLQDELAGICNQLGGRPLSHDEFPTGGTIVIVPSVEPRRFYFSEDLDSLTAHDFLDFAYARVTEIGGPAHKIDTYEV